MNEEEQVNETAKSKSSLPFGKILMVLALVLLSSASSGLVSWFLISKTMKAEAKAGQGDPEKAKEDVIAAALEKGAAIPLEPFVVNLADPDAVRYLRIKVSLMIDNKGKIK